VLVERGGRSAKPLVPLEQALKAGDSLIIFPEGTRGMERLPTAFKSGLYHLAGEFPQVELVPVFLDNLRRALPKGSLIPVPISCVARFGAPIMLGKGETKTEFLERARAAVEALA
jgi:1-acyl-sn-glycerol-3-phosphate acyltransferase